MKKTLKVPAQLFRVGTLESMDDGTMRLSISSDTPYKRYDWFDDEDYLEVLDHSPGGIDLSRLKIGAPLLYNHDRSILLGTLSDPECTDGKCYVNAKISYAPDVESYRTKIKEGILKDTSIGYELTDEGTKIGEKDGMPIYKFRFKIFEGSLVSIPADITVGVGRARQEQENKAMKEILVELDERPKESDTQTQHSPHQQSKNMNLTREARQYLEADNGNNPSGASPAIDVNKERGDAVTAERKRVSDIQRLSDHFRDKGLAGRKIDTSTAAAEHIREGKTEADFRNHVMEHEFKDVSPIETPSEVRSSGIRIIGERDHVVEAKSLGELFVRSKSYLNRSKSPGASCSIEIEGLSNFRATFSTSSVTGFSGIVQIPQIYELGVQRPTVADLLAQGTTNLQAVPFMQETSITNAATTVAEGGAKPEATFALTQTSAPVKKIAVTIPVTDEAFEDIATLESYINARLRWMVEMTEEAQLVNGDGIGSNLTGILQTSGIQTQAKGADTVPDAIKKAQTKVRFIGFAEPTGIIIHPNDDEAIMLLKDANLQYYGGGPFTGSYGQPFSNVERLWGMPKIVTTGIPENTALIGAFRMDAMIFRKKGITIDSTNSHASEFVNNIVRLRAEERLALAVFRPKSFCQITGI